ncbi:MAG: D-glycero-beta-D-manno-heptose-1,7-bisphosphate 7-phosphatase [Rhodanobacteraceae bacterium]|nr:MAG: D-glycero-beta-D-manno-heptose-1,7-bisphosphate 7-phosphatase [Rhodanobacteraceae bacterium]
MKRALFLDRDGVINVDHGYVCSPARTEFVDGIFELVAAANRKGFCVVVATNQAGIARGYYTEADFRAYMDWMHGAFREHGARLDALYYCPHHPGQGQGEYRRDCNCRKPKPGMLLAAQRDLWLDLAGSLLIGDKPSDLAAGRAAGVGSNLLLGSAALPSLRDAIGYLR